ncbi:MAG TPA: sodium/solute symporter [Fimbriiglobus sp.]|jgi:SSS family transporter|nr:sodium/solute symporter [Fimbriiglobus sp.]
MTVLDYLVIGLYAVGMLAIGAYYARQVKSADDYLLGGRSMSPLMIGLSLFATLTSTLTYLALPGEMIGKGPVIFSEFLAFPFAYLIVALVLIPRIMRQRVTSGYELLEARLGLTGRLLGALMFVLLRVAWMASILYATAHAVLIPLLGLSPSWLPAISILMGVITLVYTAEGGLKAVVVTDAVQAVLMVFGAIVTIAIITAALGGFGAWWPTEWPAHWPKLAVWPVVWPEGAAGPTPTASRNVVGAFVGMLVWMTCTAGSDQMAIQRYLATRNVAAARRSFAVQLFTTVLSASLLGLAGLAVLGYFQARPEEMPDGWSVVGQADKMMPHFIVIGLPPGLTGLVIAAILAAAMSSLSSGFNSTSAVIVTDFVGRAGGRTFTPASEVRLARFTSVGVGIAAVGLSLVVGGLAGNLLELCFKVVNLLTAPIFVLFFLALFVPRATPLAAVAATVASVAVAVQVNFGWGGVWFLWAPLAALAAGVAVGTLVSLLPVGRQTAVP